MKKHILGVALFSLIVASFAVIFAFFYTPSIPPKEAVKPPLTLNEARTQQPYSCNMRKNKLAHEVQSSQLNVWEGKLISSLKLNWNGSQEAPASVFINARIFDINKPESVSFVRSNMFRSDFNERNEAKIDFELDFYLPKDLKKAGNNFYVVFDVYDRYTRENSLFESDRIAEAKSVLMVYEKAKTVEVRPYDPTEKNTPESPVREVKFIRGTRELSR